MQLESEITILGVDFYTQGLFLILGFIFSLYALWSEGQKDGFDEEALFDRYILSVLTALLLSRALYAYGARYLPLPLLGHVFRIWEPGFSLEGFILGMIFSAIFFAYFSKWSIFRTLDIYSLSLSFGAPIAILGYVALQKDFTYLILIGALFVFYGIFSKLRLKKIISGVTFIIFLIFVALARGFFGLSKEGDLIFHFILFTIGTVILVFRISRNMSKGKSLPQSLIDSVKAKLQKKEKNIEKQEKLLEEEDPYMQEGRAVGNSEDVDEAYLEDTFKNVIDAQKSLLLSVKKNVKRALGKLSKGEYGVCEKCGEPIDPARLEAYPEASMCTECARKTEAAS